MQGSSPAATLLLIVIPSLVFLSHFPHTARGDCWLIEGDKGYVWLAICSQNQPPYETIPQHINNTVHDLRLNENKLKAVLFSSMYRFTNLTDLNLTKNEISFIEDGAFAGQANLQVGGWVGGRRAGWREEGGEPRLQMTIFWIALTSQNK